MFLYFLKNNRPRSLLRGIPDGIRVLSAKGRSASGGKSDDNVGVIFPVPLKAGLLAGIHPSRRAAGYSAGDNKHRITPRAGMTLLEAVIYISLLAVISVAVVNVFLSETSAWAHARAERDSTDAAKLILERITHEIRLASSVDAGQSVFSSHPGRLVLNTFENAISANPSTLQIFLDGNEVKLIRGTNPADSLSGTKANITRLIFYRIPSSESELVRVELSVEVLVGHSTTNKSFVTSAVLRGGY